MIDVPVTAHRSRRWRSLLFVISLMAFVWSLPRPVPQDLVVEYGNGNSSQGRLVFRTARQLNELAAKGRLADETELSGPCLADEGKTLYFARARTGQRADILRSRRDGEHWSLPQPVRELNSVDDDRRVTIDSQGRSLLLASNRSGSHGGFDLFEASRERDHWSRPKNVGEPLNTSDDEFDPALSSDGLTLYFARVSQGGTADLFVSRRERLNADWSAPQAVTAVNTPDSHERSPAVSPDGCFLYFASNRASQVGEERHFELFRASLQEDAVGAAERVADGVGSIADDVDATFSADGRTLVFASKREGPKQLYLSHADMVITRLGISTEHLDRFGRAKLAVPMICGVLFLCVLLARRRVITVSGDHKTTVIASRKVVAADRQAPAVDRPKQRSTPLRNPLENWPTTPIAQAGSRSAIDKTEWPSKSVTPVVPASKSENTNRESKRPVFAAAALITLAGSSLFFVQPSWNWFEFSQSASVPLGDEFLSFRDIVAPRSAELPKLVRSDTGRTTAPWPLVAALNETSLREAARWPVALAVIRSRQPIEQRPDNAPELTGSARQMIVAKQVVARSLSRPTELPVEAVLLAIADAVPEKNIIAANTTSIRQSFDPLAGERTKPQSAAVTNVTLRSPMPRAFEVSAASPNRAVSAAMLNPPPSGTGQASREKKFIGLPEPEAATNLIPVADTQPALLPTVTTLNRVDAVPFAAPDAGHLPISNLKSQISNLKFEVSNLSAQLADNFSASDVPSMLVALMALRMRAEPKLAALAEEPAVPNTAAIGLANSTTSSADIVAEPRLLSTSLGRLETLSPSPAPSFSSASTVQSTSVSADALSRRPSSVIVPTDIVILAGLESRSTLPVARHGMRAPNVALAGAEGDPLKSLGDGPALLLTAATQLVELLPALMIAPLPKGETFGSIPSPAPQSSVNLSKWLPQAISTWTISIGRADQHSSSNGQAFPMPRRIKETFPVPIEELVKPIEP